MKAPASQVKCDGCFNCHNWEIMVLMDHDDEQCRGMICLKPY